MLQLSLQRAPVPAQATCPSGPQGDESAITIANVFQSKGVIHVVDTVALPN